jgi:2C-methyl-D-erythritol 2,4-cyclodiphosphate synthase
MKVLILLFIIPIAAYAQCPTGYVCISQESANRAAELADRNIALQAALDAAKVQIAADATLIADQKDLIAKLSKVKEIDATVIASYVQLNAVRDALEKFQADLLERMKKQLATKTSTFGKVLNALKVAYYLVATAVLIL